MARQDIFLIQFHASGLSSRSGLRGLVECLHAEVVEFGVTWKELEKRSWRAGQALRKWGSAHYGSPWNALVPYMDERRFLRALPSGGPFVVHFLWGEFAAPKNGERYARRGGRLVGTFHASARKQPEVLDAVPSFSAYEFITLMSVTQKPYFIARGVPEDRLRVVLHGVDTEYFHPPEEPPATKAGPLRGLLVGFTERDHSFLVSVLRKLPKGVLELDILTSPEQEVVYRDTPNCRVLPRMDDAGLLRAYQGADLLVMPMLDCTANNVILESMACGTPVMTNRVGGIPEYVSSDSCFVMDKKDVGLWVDRLVDLVGNRETLTERRPVVRAWAERFSWPRVAKEFDTLYGKLLG